VAYKKLSKKERSEAWAYINQTNAKIKSAKKQANYGEDDIDYENEQSPYDYNDESAIDDADGDNDNWLWGN